MRKAEELLMALGITWYSARHAYIVHEFLMSDETDPALFLDQLGEWTAIDLAIAIDWLKKNTTKFD